MKKDDRFAMRVDGAFVSRLDEWRGARRPIPTRAEAVRHLIEKGLEAESVEAEGRDGGGEMLAG